MWFDLKQPESEQPKVEEKTLESENLEPKPENNDFSEKKQPENENESSESNQEVTISENNENKPDESNQEAITQENNDFLLIVLHYYKFLGDHHHPTLHFLID